MAKISFNMFHNMYEVYYHKKGKKHVGYFGSKHMAEVVAKSINKVFDQL